MTVCYDSVIWSACITSPASCKNLHDKRSRTFKIIETKNTIQWYRNANKCSCLMTCRRTKTKICDGSRCRCRSNDPTSWYVIVFAYGNESTLTYVQNQTQPRTWSRRFQNTRSTQRACRCLTRYTLTRKSYARSEN